MKIETKINLIIGVSASLLLLLLCFIWNDFLPLIVLIPGYSILIVGLIKIKINKRKSFHQGFKEI